MSDIASDRPGAAGEGRFVFNVVWTGESFAQLHVFTASLLAHSGARFRFVGNQCPAEQLDAMERFAARHPGRVVEVFDLGQRRMVPHGDALDAVVGQRDDGEFFAFVDTDILARGPFLRLFEPLMDVHDAVTSGREVWAETNVRPDGHIGINGEIFYDTDGFVFGCPHFAIYRRATLDAVLDRWGVSFSSSGDADISTEVRARLDEFGRGYWIYDTGKIVNVLLQADGHSLAHVESPDLVHVGGVAHFLAPPMTPEGEQPVWGENVPDWNKWAGMEARYAVAGYAAEVIRATFARRPLPEVPGNVSPTVRGRLERLRVDLERVALDHGPGGG